MGEMISGSSAALPVSGRSGRLPERISGSNTIFLWQD